MLKKDSDDDDDNDTTASGDHEDRNKDDHDKKDRKDDDDDSDDKKDSKADKEDSSETRAHRDGRSRGLFCSDIYIANEHHHCADEVKHAVEDDYTDSDVHMDSDCDEADDNEDVCLEISDSDNCDDVVDDSLDELDEWCTLTKRGGGTDETIDVVVVSTV